jgi:hypothetical protein
MAASRPQVRELFRLGIVLDNHSRMPLRTDAGFSRRVSVTGKSASTKMNCDLQQAMN